MLKTVFARARTDYQGGVATVVRLLTLNRDIILAHMGNTEEQDYKQLMARGHFVLLDDNDTQTYPTIVDIIPVSPLSPYSGRI